MFRVDDVAMRQLHMPEWPAVVKHRLAEEACAKLDGVVVGDNEVGHRREGVTLQRLVVVLYRVSAGLALLRRDVAHVDLYGFGTAERLGDAGHQQVRQNTRI